MIQIIIGIALVFVGSAIVCSLSIEDNKDELGKFLLGLISCILLIIGTAISTSKDHNEIKAIDVYRDKTELVINGEYKDSVFIPKDSIVVLKIKYD